MRLRGFCALLLLCGAARRQDRPVDVDGWGKVKWGMTFAQVVPTVLCKRDFSFIEDFDV